MLITVQIVVLQDNNSVFHSLDRKKLKEFITFLKASISYVA